MKKDICFQQRASCRADRRFAWVAIFFVVCLTGCTGNSPSGNHGDDEVAAKSIQPPAAGSYLQTGEHGREVMTMLLAVEENRYSLHISDPATNATGSLRGCIVMAAAPLVPENDGTYIAKGTDLSDEGCSLSFRSIQDQAIEVTAAGCESSCVSPIAAEELSGTYVLQRSLDEQPAEIEATQQAPDNATAAAPPVTVEWQQMDQNSIWLKVIGTSDQVTVTNVTANRGNCKVALATFEGWKEPSEVPKIIGFGEEVIYTMTVVGCPNLMEVQVDTDAGPWIFNFQ